MMKVMVDMMTTVKLTSAATCRTTKIFVFTKNVCGTWADFPVSGYSVIFQQKDLILPSLELPKFSSICLSISFVFLILSPSASCSQTYTEGR